MAGLATTTQEASSKARQEADQAYHRALAKLEAEWQTRRAEAKIQVLINFHISCTDSAFRRQVEHSAALEISELRLQREEDQRLAEQRVAEAAGGLQL